ncbi:MAG: hypothetical protein H6730_11335 [Deltaproteobacteria bacterium]|nr:hypothetical protein [Deltaproteobacteria bacterium]
MADPAKKAPSRVLSRLAGLLTETKDGLRFPPAAQAKVAAVVEVAARIPDEVRGAQALYDVARLAVALADAGHDEASQTVQQILRSSPAAGARLTAVRSGEAQVAKRFAAFRGGAEAPRAPRVDAPREGVALKDLLPVGVGRRMDPRSPNRGGSSRSDKA